MRMDTAIHPTIASREVTQHILKVFHLRASKKLGQNFLIDAAVVRGIVEAAELQEGDRVLEIGPGIGTLTQGLAESGAQVTAVELDKKLPAVLADAGVSSGCTTVACGTVTWRGLGVPAASCGSGR